MGTTAVCAVLQASTVQMIFDEATHSQIAALPAFHFKRCCSSDEAQEGGWNGVIFLKLDLSMAVVFLWSHDLLIALCGSCLGIGALLHLLVWIWRGSSHAKVRKNRANPSFEMLRNPGCVVKSSCVGYLVDTSSIVSASISGTLASFNSAHGC